MMTLLESYSHQLIGGTLIGLSAAMMLLLNGRIAGVSGIVASAFEHPGTERLTKIAFIVGLCGGPVLFLLASGAWPVVRVNSSMAVMVVAGLLVGFGTRLGSGCTSGHGVCGLARLSPRSVVAVGVFLVAGMVTVFVMNRWHAS